MDEIECTLECPKHSKCHSVNYHHGQKLCQLNRKVSADLIQQNLVEAIGWKFLDHLDNVKQNEQAPEAATTETPTPRPEVQISEGPVFSLTDGMFYFYFSNSFQYFFHRLLI